MKRAMVTGITGQDGSYLAELLLKKGYEAHGIKRRTSILHTDRIDHLFQEIHGDNVHFFLHYGDMADSSNLNRLFNKIQPDEIYHLAAQSHVLVSYEVPEYSAEINAIGTLRLLEAIRENDEKCKFFHASSSEMFGKVTSSPQTEKTPLNPRSPYAASKIFAHGIVKIYREAYNMYACNGILFNHESPRRGETFVTRKITRGIAQILCEKQEKIFLGNLDAKRDWGYAPDYMEAIWLMLQQKHPDDYIIATNEQHTVREFCELAFNHAGMEIGWEGKGINEKGIDSNTNQTVIEIDPRYFRPLEVESLMGDYSKAKSTFDWEPHVRFHELVGIMVKAEIDNMNRKTIQKVG